jgi:hypothetical protein
MNSAYEPEGEYEMTKVQKKNTVTLESIAKMLKELDFKYFQNEDEEFLRLNFSTEKYRDLDGDNNLHIIIRPEKDAMYLRVFAPSAFNIDVGNTNAFLRTCLDIQSEKPMLKFEYDDRDGEVCLAIEFVLEDAELTKRQLARCIQDIFTTLEESYELLMLANKL